MNDENKQLLDEVIKCRLEQALKSKAEDDGNNAAFRQAMEAIDRQIELSKVDASNDEILKKQEFAEKDAKINWIIRGAEIMVITLAVPIIQHRCNMRYAKVLCNFEKDYTFTTSAGRSLSRLFQFKK